jgi:MFS family permease
MQYKWIALSVTTIGTLMAGIDARIIIVGLPTVARELGADVESIIWVSQSYLLASTVGLLMIGRITDVIGRVKIYNIGFAVFTIGSALASICQSPLQLILSRIVQGRGSAMLITNSAAILTDATPSNELGTILGINQIAFRIGSVAGLTLSGVIIAIYGWRALFYLNIPVGISDNHGQPWRNGQRRISDSFDYNRHTLLCLLESAAQHEPRCTGAAAGTGIYKRIQGCDTGVCNHQLLCDHSILSARTGEGKTCRIRTG